MDQWKDRINLIEKNILFFKLINIFYCGDLPHNNKKQHKIVDKIFENMGNKLLTPSITHKYPTYRDNVIKNGHT